MSYTTIQVKRTNNKTLDDSSLANIVPAYGEIVFSHTSGKDEFVIGDNSTTIPNLPRLNLQSINKFKSFDGNTLTLGDATHKGTIILNDGSNNTTTIQPSSTNNDITVTLPDSSGTLATTNDLNSINYATSDTPAGPATQVKSTDRAGTNEVRYLASLWSYGGASGYNNVGYDARLSYRYHYSTAMAQCTLNIGNSTLGDRGFGELSIYHNGHHTTVTCKGGLSSNNFISLPDADGTLALVGGNIGAATATTPTAGDSSTKVATTEFVTNAISGSSTDEKLAISLNTSGTSYYPIIGTGTTASTRQYDTNFTYTGTKGTTTNVGTSVLTLGNNIGSGTANNEQGQLVLYGNNTHKVTVQAGNPTSDITITLPNSADTLATNTFVNTAISNNTKVVLPTSAPSSPVTGQIYVDLTDTNAPILKVWNGSAWKPVVGVWG